MLAGWSEKRPKLKSSVPTDTGTDLLLMYALQRRALAFDQRDLIGYDLFHTWTQTMLS